MTEDRGPGRVAGVDFGAARIGLAVSDELGLLAHPRPFVPAAPPGRALRLLRELAKKEGIVRFVVGLPRHLDGSEGISARKAREFGLKLGEATGIEVEFIDERFSTVEAHARLRESGHDGRSRKTKVDSAAAALLLQGWLDGRPTS